MAIAGTDILAKLTDVFRDVLDRPGLVLTRETTADDVERFLAQLPEAVAEVRRAGGAEGL